MSLTPVMSDALAAEEARARTLFLDRGARLVETPTLLSADRMLDLYGEDIRNRAYIVHDPLEGEFVLRPDFTVPIVEAHMRDGAEPARYAYSGRVWRKRRETARADRSFWQMGFEIFDRGDAAAMDAEIVALAVELAQPFGLTAKLGDLGLIMHLLDTLEMSEARRNALKRHVWRPRAFARLLARFANDGSKHGALALDPSIPINGLRSAEMIEARIARLAADANDVALPTEYSKMIEALWKVSGSLPDAQKQLGQLADQWREMKPLTETLDARMDALATRKIDPASLEFDAKYGRETMEYYDGLVFGFWGKALAPIISGGRYDGLTALLGDPAIPAIGLAYRPALAMGDS